MKVDSEPPLSSNSKVASQLQKYYWSLESRIGYYLVLGGTRHFGYYEPGTKWPFPINDALRKMEDRMFDALALPPGSKALDAGCGVGHVAMQMSRRGLHVQGIDIMKEHVRWAQQNVQKLGLKKAVSVRWMDYHDLSAFEDASFDGVYTMETLVHAHDPGQVLGEFLRVLKPGGSLALWEYEHADFSKAHKSSAGNSQERKWIEAISQINRRSSMPGNQSFTDGVLYGMLEEEGFQDIKRQDLTENVMPMLRYFYVLAYIPWLIICCLGLQTHFVNTQAGAQGYPMVKRRMQRYSAFTARKPLGRVQRMGGPRERKVG